MKTGMAKAGVALGLAVLAGMGSTALLLSPQHTPCEQRAPLTVLAMLAAFVIALCIRQFAGAISRAARIILITALLMAAACLFADARFVLQYRDLCNAPLPAVNSSP